MYDTITNGEYSVDLLSVPGSMYIQDWHYDTYVAMISLFAYMQIYVGFYLVVGMLSIIGSKIKWGAVWSAASCL